jgi:hypothetical protein
MSHADPLTRRRRRAFAFLRVMQVSLLVIGGTTALLALTPPPTPGHLTRELRSVAWSTPLTFVTAGGACIAAAILLQGIAVPLKRRWAEQLRGWVE